MPCTIWRTATSLAGEIVVVAPATVAPGSTADFDPDVVVTPSAVIAKLGGAQTLLRRYNHDGVLWHPK